METREYIILRQKNPITLGFDHLARGGPAGVGGAIENITLEQAALTPSERADLRRDPRTRAMAEPMPLKLIEPVKRKELTADEVEAGATWGVEAVRATASPFDGSGVTVAVLDTGIDPTHKAFQGVNLVQENFTEEGPNDQNGHGTHCAGTIFGKDVDGVRIGIARNVDRALIGKVLGEGGGSSGTIAEAIDWAVRQGAHIISMSLGIDFPGYVKRLIEEFGFDATLATSMALEQYRANLNLFDALAAFVGSRENIFDQGSILVAASGNESQLPRFAIAAAPPSAAEGIIAVGALGKSLNGFQVANFSNHQVDISAPGVDVVSAWIGGGLAALDGTSMATPHAAGVAALWAQRLRETTGEIEGKTLTAQLVARATLAPLASGFEEDAVGTGIVQAPV